MADDETSSVTPRPPLRPALLLDAAAVARFAPLLRRLLVGFASEGYASAMICPPQCDTSTIVSPLVETIPYPVFQLPIFARQNWQMLVDRLGEFEPTVLHCMSLGRSNLASHVAEELDIPYVLTFHTAHIGWHKPVVSPLRCAAITASTAAAAERLRKAYPSISDRIVHVSDGTFVEDTCACFIEPGRVPSLVVAQPLDRMEHFEALLGAVRQLVVNGYKLILAIVGDGPAGHAVHRTIVQSGLALCVTMTGDIRPLRSIFAGADIFVQTRPADEGHTNLLEAMGVGLAVACNRQGADDFTVEDRSAVFFDPRDELSIYKSLQKLLDDRDFARRIAAAGQEYLRRNHSVSRMVEELIRIYTAGQQWFAGTNRGTVAEAAQ